MIKLPLIPVDKANHFVYAVVLFTPLAFVIAPLIALGVVVVIGVAKEIYDKVSGTGNPEGWDVVATAAGAGFGYLCTFG